MTFLPSVRFNKKTLARKLKISERALSSWQQEGMPVLERGRRGQGNCYDLIQVLAWIRRTGRGVYGRRGQPGIDLVGLEREFGVLPVQTSARPGPDARAVARAIALARVAWVADLESWDFETSPRDFVDAVGLFIGALSQQLAAAGLPGIEAVLDEFCSDASWPDDLAQIVARCRSEVPP